MMRYAKYLRELSDPQHMLLQNRSNSTPSKIVLEGCQRLTMFKHYHLQEQQRSGDPQHTTFVKHLSNGLPIDIKHILNMKPLSFHDLKYDFNAWAFAPILVATNAERLNIIRFKAQLFAAYHQTYVLKWHNTATHYINRPTNEEMPSIMQQHPFFWQFFVAGAEAYLDWNINTDLGLVNGSLIKLHSLTFENDADKKTVLDMCKTPGLKYGSEIIIPTPAFVNIIVHENDDSQDSEISVKKQTQKDILLEFSQQMGIDKRPTSKQIIIPLTASKKGKEAIRYSFQPYEDSNNLCQLRVKQIFPYDLAFAMTVHKAQGRTIPRGVIVDITQHPATISNMEYAAIFVALSRVKHGNHLRLLEPFNNVDTRASLYKWLTLLRPNNDIAPFLRGFTPSQPWSFRRALNSI